MEVLGLLLILVLYRQEGVPFLPSCGEYFYIFARHLLMASIESAKSSTLVSQSSTERKIRPASFAWTLNCDGFFFAGIVIGRGVILLWSII